MDDEIKLWKKYKEEKDLKAREQLLLNYSYIVKNIVEHSFIQLPNYVSHDDLLNAGFIGLIDAVEKFDYTKDIKFITYATIRVKGAILDELRQVDWVPRGIRKKAKDLEKVLLELENKLGRYPTDEEIASYMSISLDELFELYSEIGALSLVSIDEEMEKGEKHSFLEILADDSAENPITEAEKAELRQVLEREINILPEREKLVIALYYYEELTFKEIGSILELTESRVSQIHAKTLLKLRTHLESYALKMR